MCLKKITLAFSLVVLLEKGGKIALPDMGAIKFYVQGTCFLNKIIILVLNYLLSLSSVAFAFRDRSLGE